MTGRGNGATARAPVPMAAGWWGAAPRRRGGRGGRCGCTWRSGPGPIGPVMR